MAAHHVRRTVAEQVLDIELADIMGDGICRERVAEAVGVHLGDARLTAEYVQPLLETVDAEADTGVEVPVARDGEERSGAGAVIQKAGGERGGAAVARGTTRAVSPFPCRLTSRPAMSHWVGPRGLRR